MNVLIVYAHPEPKSFNGAMRDLAVEALAAAGHAVAMSDLYAMGFNPVAGRDDITGEMTDPDFFSLATEQTAAYQAGRTAPDIAAEMEKLKRADLVIFQFPVWWFGMPAILKGWVDRVFAAGGRIYGGGKWYDRGVFAGKRAMCSVTIGGGEPMYSAHGINGPIDTILFPINHGMLYFTGFTVIEPFLVHGPARMSDGERAAALDRYRAHVLGLATAPVIGYPKLADYDENNVLRAARA